jgi:hypothetical protein
MTARDAGEPSMNEPVLTRRKHPRYAAHGRIACELLPHYLSVTVVDMSRGGVLVRSPMTARLGDIQRFRFRIASERDAIFVLRAQVVHCTATIVNGGMSYLTGLEFVETNSPVYQRAIEQLIDAVAS